MPISNILQAVLSKIKYKGLITDSKSNMQNTIPQKIVISMIYHPEERYTTEYWENQLVKAGYEVRLAPLGLEVNSESWKNKVVSDIQDSSFVLILLTPKSVNNDSVMWRFQLAYNTDKSPLIPILVEEFDRSKKNLIPEVLMYNWLWATSDEWREDSLRHLLSWLPKVRSSIFCFISYSHSDEDFAIKLRKDLKEHGIEVWRDADDIPAGSMWDVAIQDALNKSSHILIILTPKSVQSQNVADEIGFALNKNKVIVPLLLQEVELPLRIHRAQYIDFREDYESALTKLLNRLDN